MSARERLLGAIDIATCLGVEIGALHAPTVRRAEGRILYADYAPADVLRANLRHPGVVPEDVLEVDIVWGERPLREAVGEPADYMVARHVLEHVPDLIGWLLEIHAALKPGGTLGLAIPDRRFTFDACRAESGIAEVMAAHVERRTRPSVQQIVDVAAFSQVSQNEQDWRSRNGGALPPAALAALPRLYRWLPSLAAPAAPYTDAHCWVFTPAAFLALAEAMAVIGCFPYRIDAFFPTEAGADEFQVRLRAIAMDLVAESRASIAAAVRALPSAGRETADVMAARVNCLEIARLHRVIAALHASSSWRLTAPLRRLARAWRRGPFVTR